MTNQRKRKPKQNKFLKFFKVLSRSVRELPKQTKRNAIVVCSVMIVLGIIISAIAFPKLSYDGDTKKTEEPASRAATAPTVKQTSHKVEGIPVIVQDYYKAGCETYAATMLLQGLGYNITEHQFVDNYLILHDFSYDDEGNMYGPDMNSAFAGDIFSGAGIFCPAMAKSMNKYLATQKNDNRRAYPIKGKTLEYLCKEYIDKDIPVMTWVTTYMEESYDKLSWIVDYVDENAEYKVGETMTWRQNEHCMVLIGYTDRDYLFCDSVAGKVVSHEKSLAETRFTEIGNQAVVVTDKAPAK